MSASSNPAMMKQMKGFLFDLDGTLIASESLKARALADVCASYGIEANHDTYKEVMGRDWLAVRNHFLARYRFAPVVSEFDERFRSIYLDLLEAGVAETPGAIEFLDASRRNGIKLGLVSSAAAWMVRKIFEKLALHGVFDAVLSREDVIQHKPSPEAFLLATTPVRVGEF